jgi:hypothetical protein
LGRDGGKGKGAGHAIDMIPACSRSWGARGSELCLGRWCREEQVAYDALKKQMVFYQHTLSAAGLKRGDSFGFREPQLSTRGERPELAGAALAAGGAGS